MWACGRRRGVWRGGCGGGRPGAAAREESAPLRVGEDAPGHRDGDCPSPLAQLDDGLVLAVAGGCARRERMALTRAGSRWGARTLRGRRDSDSRPGRPRACMLACQR